MEENDQSQNIPLLCRKGCGFYGSPNFDGFCSKCHRSMQVQAENVQPVSRVTSDFEDKLSPERSVKITASSGENFSKRDSSLVPPVTIKISSDPHTDSSLNLSAESNLTLASPAPELRAETGISSIALPDSLNDDLKSDSKPDSPGGFPVPTNPAKAPDIRLSQRHPMREGTSTSSSGPATKTRPRCAVCHKRVGLTGFSCRCGGLYCSIHRYSDAHNCSYDYRESGQEEIRRSNPQIVCQKVQKI
ncbi:unnamed protein product [Schistosoma curassoni]|uniref:AN1-type zinc finger protein 6 n=1 Tax=Schistosoma curassoni TaxID=6186 RepID=A0A183KGP4_9TREM|nr:unnamed protein product [Schistosoma curassoni]